MGGLIKKTMPEILRARLTEQEIRTHLTELRRRRMQVQRQ